MVNKITDWVYQISGKILDGGGVSSYMQPSLAQSVELAREEWLNARAYFEAVSEPDLVDHAIYTMEATEKRYIYLLKKARAEGVTVDVY